MTRNANVGGGKVALQYDGSNWVKAQANDLNTTALGIVVEVTDVNTFTYALGGRYVLTAHGLTPDEWYYLSQDTAGGLVTDSPFISQAIVYAETIDIVSVYPYRPAITGATEFNIDGGRADDIFLPIQNIDGGGERHR